MHWSLRRRSGTGATLLVAALVAACSTASPPPVQTETGGSTGTGGSTPSPTGGAMGTGGGGGSGAPAVDSGSTSTTPDAGTEADSGGTTMGGDDAQGTTTQPGDDPPDRPLNMDKASPQLYTVKFKPTDVDPASTGKDETQTAQVDTSKPMQKKLVIVLAGTGGAPGPLGVASFVASLGFHAYAIAYHDEYNASTGTGANAEIFTNSRFNEFDGKGRTP